MRVPPWRFEKELLRGERRTLGRYDSRLEGEDADAAGDRPGYDPSYASRARAYTPRRLTITCALSSSMRPDLSYEILTDKVSPWSYKGIREPLCQRRRDVTRRNDSRIMT